MFYEKPELLILSAAAMAVRGHDGTKGMNTHEAGINSDDGSHNTGDGGSTSSTGSAYEVDE